MNSLVFVTLMFTLTNCLKSNDFCKLQNEKHPCHGSFNLKCTSEVCSRNKTVCLEYRQMKTNLKLFSSKNDKVKYVNEMIKLQVTKNSFKNCKINPNMKVIRHSQNWMFYFG